LLDFVCRVDLRHVGKRALESLIRVGALDTFGKRVELLESIDYIMSYSASHFRAIEVGQLSLFGEATGVQEKLTIPETSYDIPRRQQLGWEKELLGLYVSDHPLNPFMDDLSKIVSHFSGELDESLDGQSVCVAGMVTHVRPYQTRKGRAMGFISLEDLQGTIELVVFTRVWEKVVDWIKPDMVVVVRGKVDAGRGEPKVLAFEISSEARIVESLEEGTRQDIFDGPAPKESAPPGKTGSNGQSKRDDNSAPMNSDGMDPKPTQSTAESIGSKEENKSIEPFTEAPNRKQADTEESHKFAEDSLAGEEDGGVTGPEVALSYQSNPNGRHRVIVEIRASGDKQRDALRMRRIHGLLTSYPGQDRFAFVVHEGARRYMLEFPSSSTGYCEELEEELKTLLGENSVQVEARIRE
jgi:DNA polymerase-3 subunit alpha